MKIASYSYYNQQDLYIRIKNLKFCVLTNNFLMHEFTRIVRVLGVGKLKVNAPNHSSNSYNM